MPGAGLAAPGPSSVPVPQAEVGSHAPGVRAQNRAGSLVVTLLFQRVLVFVLIL